MENNSPMTEDDLPERTAEDIQPDDTPPWQTEPESPDKKRDLKERFFLTRKELRDAQRLLALREEELRKLRLAERHMVEQSHDEENLKSSLGRLQKRVDELQRQLTDSRNQLRQARTEAAERSTMVPLMEKETTELREQLEQDEVRLTELSSLLEQREGELREKNGSLHEAGELSDRLDQRERDLLEREEELHETRERLGRMKGELESARQTLVSTNDERDEAIQQLGAQRGEVDSARQAASKAIVEQDAMTDKLARAESVARTADETITMLQEKLVDAGEELIKQEESVRDYRYLMESLKREKTDLEAASSRTLEELEKKVETSSNECEGLREMLDVRQQERENAINEKNDMANRLDQADETHRRELTSMDETHARTMEDLKDASNREMTGLLQVHAQEIDKLKMMHAGERGELRDSADRLQQDLGVARERASRLQSELDEARQGIPQLVARVEERELAIRETRSMLVETLAKLEGLDQPPELELAIGQVQPDEQSEAVKWPDHQSFGDLLEGLGDEPAEESDSNTQNDFPPATSLL